MGALARICKALYSCTAVYRSSCLFFHNFMGPEIFVFFHRRRRDTRAAAPFGELRGRGGTFPVEARACCTRASLLRRDSDSIAEEACCGIDHYATRVVMVKKRFCCIFTILILVSAVKGNSCKTTKKKCPADEPQCWLEKNECKLCAEGRDSSGVSGLYGGTQATCNECKKGKFRAKG